MPVKYPQRLTYHEEYLRQQELERRHIAWMLANTKWTLEEIRMGRDFTPEERKEYERRVAVAELDGKPNPSRRRTNFRYMAGTWDLEPVWTI